MLPIAAIQEKLAFLYERTPDKAVYGSTKTEREWYALNPVMPEPALQAFEARLGVRLPESVREFVLKVGNGGAGPFRGLGDHCFLWGIGHVDLHTPFDWGDFIRVKKYTEAEFKQKKKGEMERILRFYGRYIPVERPNRYQKEVKAFYNIDLEEDEYIQYGPLRGCLPIFQNWHKMVYLMIAGEPDYVGRVLLGPSLDGESVGGLYELRGCFSEFYAEWLESEVRALSSKKYLDRYKTMPYQDAYPGIPKPAIRVLFPGPVSAKAATPDFIDEASIGCWVCTEDKDLLIKGEVTWSERNALHLSSVDRDGNPLSEYILEALIAEAERIGLDQRNKAAIHWAMPETGRLQETRAWILYTEKEVPYDSLCRLAQRVLEAGNQDVVTIEVKGRVKMQRL